MEKTVTHKVRKATVIPVPYASWDFELSQPIQVAESLSFENVQGLLKPELFNLWRDMVSKQQRDDLTRSRFGLIHRFESSGHVGREESDSDAFAYKVFLCLRLIKPTKADFQRIQIKFLGNGELEVFSFQHPSIWPNIPDAESINDVDLKDILRLRTLLPRFLRLADVGPENVRRAVRHFNVGYSELRDPIVQIVVWTMGIESLFSEEDNFLPREELIARITETVGATTDIYQNSPMREYIGEKSFVVGALIPDLLRLRDRFVHGQWIPSDWKTRIGRHSLAGGPINYADVLREAASFVLRTGILEYLERRITAD